MEKVKCVGLMEKVMKGEDVPVSASIIEGLLLTPLALAMREKDGTGARSGEG